MSDTTTTCTMTIFGRPMADMPKADADKMRSHLADLTGCQCADCAAVIARRGF